MITAQLVVTSDGVLSGDGMATSSARESVRESPLRQPTQRECTPTHLDGGVTVLPAAVTPAR